MFRHPCPYLHQQNGRIKKKHRAITEFGLSLLAHASMPLRLQWETFSTMTYLLNRLPSVVIENISPFQTLIHQEPNYRDLIVYGSSCYPYIRPYKKHKLSYYTEKCAFLGYSLFHKGYYKCLASSGKLYIVKQVDLMRQIFLLKKVFFLHPLYILYMVMVIQLRS